MKEIWKDIKGYEGLYQVSNLGNVKRIRFINIHSNYPKEKMKSKKLRKDGYYEIALYKNGKGKSIQIHRLVAKAFIKEIDGKEYVNHINGIKTDNRVENLEWVTASENKIHSINVLGKETKAVEQYTLDGKFVAKYMSIKQAGDKNNIRPSNISNVLAKRRKKTGGFIWKYAEDL